MALDLERFGGLEIWKGLRRRLPKIDFISVNIVVDL